MTMAGRVAGTALVLLNSLIVMNARAEAQQISLDDALRRAESSAYATRAADAAASAARADALRPARGILPSVRLEAGWARTTDPIGAFGTTLRQRVITQADFDPARLNYPDPISNYGAAVVLEQPLLNVDAHLGRRAAVRAGTAASASAEWTRGSVGVDVVRAYYAGVLATERIETLRAAQEAAESHVKQAEHMVEQGMVTKSDALLARVKAGEIAAELAQAEGDAGLVGRRVAVLLGAPGESLELPSGLPATAQLAALNGLGWDAGTDGRADVRAAAAASQAASLDASRAWSSLLPRLNAQARYDWHSAASPFAGDESWSVGVMATWTVFSGAAEIADGRSARARAQAARAQAEGAAAQADLEIAAAATAWEVALERLTIAEQSLEQATEAHRIVTRMYAGGLATAAELLGAAASETETRLRLAAARYDVLVAAAERLHALGRSVHELAAALAAADN
jgi:outer membrane protein TolC